MHAATTTDQYCHLVESFIFTSCSQTFVLSRVKLQRDYSTLLESWYGLSLSVSDWVQLKLAVSVTEKER